MRTGGCTFEIGTAFECAAERDVRRWRVGVGFGGESMVERLVRWAGAAGMVGGTLWLISTVMHASKPVGCVADQCASRPMRESSAVEGMLTVAAFVLFAVAAVALVALARRAGRFGTAGRAGAVLALGGATALVLAALVQALFFEGDFPLMPYFVIPGLAAVVIGFILLGVMVLRSGVLPRWAAASLLVGTVAMVGFNEQTAAAWLAIPFGLAWIAVGYALWTKAPSPITADTARPSKA